MARFGPPAPRAAQQRLKDNDISRLDAERRPLTADSIPSDTASHAIDPKSAQRLWALSEQMLKA
ncbi:hypothetical protein ACQKGO_37405 [Corallococcus interemptor]|uniref:hypothetical protein n=1 Tax=Corallococcus interemptor TaxID=2316720 RepID=UPI003D04420E